MYKAKLKASAGVLDLIGSARDNRRDPGANFMFGKGDLCQMAAVRRLLTRNSIDVRMNNVYPCVQTKEEYLQGLKLIFETRCEGYWNYSDELIENDICTPLEFADAFQYGPVARENFLNCWKEKGK